jgi:hypothetical protein
MIVRTSLGLALLMTLAIPARAASAGQAPPPLPAKPQPAAPAQQARTCTIGTFKGVFIPGTSVCTKVGGFMRYEAGAGGSR